MKTLTVMVNGMPMPWGEEGSGTAVLVLHGISASPALWRHAVPRRFTNAAYMSTREH